MDRNAPTCKEAETPSCSRARAPGCVGGLLDTQGRSERARARDAVLAAGSQEVSFGEGERERESSPMLGTVIWSKDGELGYLVCRGLVECSLRTSRSASSDVSLGICDSHTEPVQVSGRVPIGKCLVLGSLSIQLIAPYRLCPLHTHPHLTVSTPVSVFSVFAT